MKELPELRREIDEIDGRLAALFGERMELADEVAAAKQSAGIPVSDPVREREILAKVSDAVPPGCASGARLLFTTLFGIAKARQRSRIRGLSPLAASVRDTAAAAAPLPERAIVACPGAEGSYSQQAVSALFPLPTILYFNGFANVFDAVEKGLCPYGVLPIENSTAGSVAQVYDLMASRRFHVVRAARVRTDHALLAVPGSTLDGLREIASHPHALAQCSAFLAKHPGVAAVPAPNTAVAAKALAASGAKDRAAIASRACAELYGLEVLADGISDAPNGCTRFICISRNLEITPDAGKFGVMMTLPHRPGSLYGILSRFAAIGVNLTKLESRPVPGRDFEFRFTFEFDSPPGDPGVIALLSELSQDPGIERFTFLGAYAEI